MRTHGWSGAAPATDDEAVARILTAAGKAIDERGADVSIADVARTLGVTRQTVYRYFPSTEALLVAAAVHAAGDFLERLADHLQGITDPADAVAEAIATALEWLPKDKHIGLLVMPGRANAHVESVTSEVALQFANAMLRRFDVDWAAAGYGDADLQELARAPAADHPIVRHRPGPATATWRGPPPLPASVGWLGVGRPPLTLRTSVMSFERFRLGSGDTIWVRLTQAGKS